MLLLKQTVPHQQGISLLREHPTGMSVELLDWMGNDIDIVNAARVSLGKKSDYEWWIDLPPNKTVRYDDPYVNHVLSNWNSVASPPQPYPLMSAADDGLLRYLMEQKHGTPFEMVQLKFRIRAPIGVVWEWVRHRIASYNVMSTRYVEWEKAYYTPLPEDWRTQVGKPGHYNFESLSDEQAEYVNKLYYQAMEDAFLSYDKMIHADLAKEVARNVLPMGAMTEFIWSINVRSMLNFLYLRNEKHALREIQFCAQMVEELTGLVVPVTLEKWNNLGRIAP